MRMNRMMYNDAYPPLRCLWSAPKGLCHLCCMVSELRYVVIHFFRVAF